MPSPIIPCPLSQRKTIQTLLNHCTSLVVLGVGSDLRADDAAGLLAARELILLLHHPTRMPVYVLLGETAPENLTGEIRRLAPSHVLIIDAADMGSVPGTVLGIAQEKVAGISFASHALPLSVLCDYLSRETGAVTALVGIQPATLKFGDPITEGVRIAAHRVAVAIAEFVLQADCI